MYETKLRSFEVSRETMNFDCPSHFRLSRIVKTYHHILPKSVHTPVLV